MDFRIKQKSDVCIEYRLLQGVFGFHGVHNQEQEVDYHESFSPVINPTTIRIVVGLTLSKHWSTGQLDVDKTFLKLWLRRNDI